MLSVVVAIMGEQPERVTAFMETLRCIRQQTLKDYEFVIVEQYSEEPLWREVADLALARYIAVQDDIHCRSWCKNVGARETVGDTLVFLDADVIFGNNYFRIIAETFDPRNGYSAGWNSTLWLTRVGLEEYQRTRIYIPYWVPIYVLWDLPIGLEKGTTFGLSTVFERGFFDRLGGFNENYVLWAPDDKDMLARAAAASGDSEFHTLDYTMIHLWHGFRKKGPEEEQQRLLSYVKKYPLEVSELLVAANLGNPEHRIVIDFTELN